MKKIILILGLISVYFLNINAQEVISSSGDYFENATGSVSWTLGEAVTETFTDGTNILTQGFQQSRLSAVSVFELKDIGITVSVAPNPTVDFINLSINDTKKISYELFDLNGKIIKQAKIHSNDTKISFSGYSYAVYFLKIKKDNKIIKTFKIVKQ